jgi:hypothetical protein
MINSIETEVIWQNPILFMIKKKKHWNKVLGIEENALNVTKNIQIKFVDSTISNVRDWKLSTWFQEQDKHTSFYHSN